MPARYQYLLNDGADTVRPLFVVFPGSPERISKGLKGAGLPAITYADETLEDSATAATPAADAHELNEEAAETFDFADLDDIGNAEMTSE